jgi:selenocysteine-specific elongation factor
MADLVEIEVREFLKGSFLERSPILRVSSHTGEGIPDLKNLLRESIKNIGPKDAGEIFRLPIDRCFTMKGFGTVVTGTLIAGRVQKEEEVEILPAQRVTRVRGIQVHGSVAAAAAAGQRTALNLQGIDVADVQRGMVLTAPHLFTPASMLDCYIELLPSAAPIEFRKRVRFHTGTAELMANLVLLGQDRLMPGGSAFAQIRLEEPAFALPGDRFIIRQYSPMITIGGGEILDAHPEKHRSSDPRVIERLKVFKNGGADDAILKVIEDAGLHGIELPKLAARRGITPARVKDRLLAIAKKGQLRILTDNPMTVVSGAAFKSVSDAAATAVKRFHETNPLVQGINREELKGRVFGDSSNIVFQAVLDKLVADKKIAVALDVIHEFGRKVTLKADEEQIRAQLIERFRALSLQVPSPDEVIDSLKLDRTTARKILQLMLKENTLVKINEEMVIDRETLDKLIAGVRALKSRNPKLGVAEFKDLTGVSRKYAIPLLEYLDRQRVTRRVGDERTIL